jgi:hypothetical protein
MPAEHFARPLVRRGASVGASCELSAWRSPLATHDPAKVLTDLALMLATAALAQFPWWLRRSWSIKGSPGGVP